MDSGRLIFDSSISQQHGHMLHLGGGGGGGNPIFRGERSVLHVEEGGNKRRPFFTSLDELLEEYYDEQLPEKKRRLSPEQVHLLEQSFETENKLEPDRKSELARKLGLQPRQVAVWFQNRRARWKTKQLERDFDRLRSSYDELVAEHGALLKDNDRLRSHVFSLTEKIHAQELAAATIAGSKMDNQTAAAEAEAEAEEEEEEFGIQEQQRQKAEDRVSTGSGGSVVDEEGPQLVDSGEESYFRESYRGGCVVGVQSEEDDGSDGGCDYYPAGTFAENQNPGGWWVWN